MKYNFQHKCLQATRVSYTLSCIPALFALIIVPAYFLKHQSIPWDFVAIFLSFFLLSIAWLKCFKITINSESITYRRLFGGTSPPLPLRCIKSVKVYRAKGNQPYSDRKIYDTPYYGWGPNNRLEIESYDKSKYETMVINLTIFDLKEIRQLISELETIAYS